eukprot:3940915-Rhodomonas_salina.2
MSKGDSVINTDDMWYRDSGTATEQTDCWHLYDFPSLAFRNSETEIPAWLMARLGEHQGTGGPWVDLVGARLIDWLFERHTGIVLTYGIVGRVAELDYDG